MWWLLGLIVLVVLLAVPLLRGLGRESADMGSVSSDWLARHKLDRRSEF
jgi:hypothetical protein